MYSNSVTLHLAVLPVHVLIQRLSIFITGQYLYSWPQAALFSESHGIEHMIITEEVLYKDLIDPEKPINVSVLNFSFNPYGTGDT